MENTKIYEQLRAVPENAKKPITAGRLKNMTNISPMWRIKRLTEVFGPCGIGWKPEISDKRTEEGADGQKIAIVDINLYIRNGEQWSDPIPGTGGSMLVANETKGPYTSDEAFKMAYTDAISVAAKMLGLGADVYYREDLENFSENTKYDKDDLSSHNVLAVRARIEQEVTAKINAGMDFKDILSALRINEKQFRQILGYADKLKSFEKAILSL